jgi:hypothetical protein
LPITKCVSEAKGSTIQGYSRSAYFYTMYSNNPAWVCFDILTQPIYDDNLNPIEYRGVDPSRMDIAKFKEWADYCDDLVPDGVGGFEKRMTFNGGFDTETTMWEAAMQVCQVGRAALIWSGSGLSVAIDKPTLASQMFTIGNTGIDSFKETFLSLEDRAAQIDLDYTNQDNDYKRDKVTVLNEFIDNPTNAVSLQLIGITKASEAWRNAMYRLNNNQYVLRALEIQADIDAIACTIGDVVNVQADVPVWGFGGRIVTADSTSVTLDRTVYMQFSLTYTIMIRLGDDSIAERGVVNYGTNNYTTLQVTSPFSTIPSQFDVYSFGEIGKAIKPFRVLSLSLTQEQKVTLTCSEYNESIYNSDYGQPVLPTPNYSSELMSATIGNVQITEEYMSELSYSRLKITYVAPSWAVYQYVELWVSKDSGNNYSHYTDSVGDIYIDPCFQGELYFLKLRAVKQFTTMREPLDNIIAWSYQVLGKLLPPSDVTNFTCSCSGDNLTFKWDSVPEKDVLFYEIRMGESFALGIKIFNGNTNTYTMSSVAPNTYNFWIKAVDAQYEYSNNAAYVQVTVVYPVGYHNPPDYLWTTTWTNGTFLNTAERYEASLGPVLYVTELPQSSANIDLRTSALGSVSPTFTRATTATLIDFEGVVRYALSGELRFSGARRVQNLLSHTDFASGWTTYVVSTGTSSISATGCIAPDGTKTGCILTVTPAYLFDIGGVKQVLGSSVTVGKCSVWMRSSSVSSDYQVTQVTFCGTVVQISSVWKRYSVDVYSTDTFSVETISPPAPLQPTQKIYLWHPQFENVMGQSNPTTAEYVSNGVLSSPYYGAMADGVRYFDYYNGNVVDSGTHIVSEARGGFFASGTVLGELCEYTKTNLCLRSEAFDVSPWSLYNLSVSQGYIAPDGNITANLLTDNSVSTYGFSGQAITISGTTSNYIVSVFVQKTVNGTAPWVGVNLLSSSNVYARLNTDTGETLNDSGSGGTYVGVQNFNSSYWRLYMGLPAATTLTVRLFPAVSFAGAYVSTVAATGSSVFWGVQVENGPATLSAATSIPSTYMPTASSTFVRNTDALTYPTTTLLATNNCSGIINWTQYSYLSSTYSLFYDANNIVSVSYGGGVLYFTKYIGGNGYSATYNITPVLGTTYKVAWRLSSTAGVDIFVNGVKGTNNSNTSNSSSLGATVSLGEYGMYITGVMTWGSALTDAQLQNATNPTYLPAYTGTWTSPVYDMTSVKPMRFWDSLNFYVRGSEFYWTGKYGANDAWTKYDSTSNWRDIFTESQAENIAIDLYYASDTTNYTTVNHFELYSIEVTARYIQYKITLTNVSENSYLLVAPNSVVGTYWK